MNQYFESCYLTWEITSKENLKFILGTFAHLDYLEENEVNTWKYSETSDYYFQQRPIGGHRPYSISGLNIPNTELISILLNYGLIPGENNSFVADQSMDKYRQQIQNANCFSNSSYAIFFSSENNIVEYIWFNYEDHLSLEKDRFDISQLLNHLGDKYSFVLIDWYDKVIIDLLNIESIRKYLDDTAAANSR